MRPCSKCEVVKPLADYYPDKSKRDGHHSVCKECVKADRKARYAADPETHKARHRAWHQRHGAERMRRANADLRAAALDAYGGCCSCCGEEREVFLAIDHIHNDGAIERAKHTSSSSIYGYLRRLGYPKDRYQLLCHNCNWAKYRLGECPHVSEHADV